MSSTLNGVVLLLPVFPRIADAKGPMDMATPRFIDLTAYFAGLPGDRLLMVETPTIEGGDEVVPPALEITAMAFTGLQITVWLRGGVPWVDYTISFPILTVNGVRDVRSVKLLVIPR
jgi:hypothetical protein